MHDPPSFGKQKKAKDERIFVSYCTKDENRIRIYLNILEDLGYQINDPERDFVPGEPVLRNIVENGMELSRASILFISKNFISSGWCQYEANMAVWKYITTKGRYRVIPIVLDNCKVPSYIKVLNCIYLWKYNIRITRFGAEAIACCEQLLRRFTKAVTGPHFKFRRIQLTGVKAYHKGKDLLKKTRNRVRKERLDNEEETDKPSVFSTWRFGKIIGHCILNCKHGDCSFSCNGRNYKKFEKHLETCQYMHITCTNYKCTFTCARKMMKRHLEECPFTKVKCPYENCAAKFDRRYIDGHKTVCKHRNVPCLNKQNGCTTVLAFQNLKKHADICLYIAMQCKKCEGSFLRKDQEKHVCPDTFISCPNCKRDIIARDLEDHVVDCTTTEIPCNYCKLLFTKFDIVQHSKECPYKLHTCKHPGCRYNDTEQQVLKHMLKCEYKPRQCGNCGKFLPSKTFTQHLHECRENIVCDLCGLTIQRSSKPTHDRYICSGRRFRSQCRVCHLFVPFSEIKEHLKRHYDSGQYLTIKNENIKDPTAEADPGDDFQPCNGLYKPVRDERRRRTFSNPEFSLETFMNVVDDKLPFSESEMFKQGHSTTENEWISLTTKETPGCKESLEKWRKLLKELDKNLSNIASYQHRQRFHSYAEQFLNSC